MLHEGEQLAQRWLKLVEHALPPEGERFLEPRTELLGVFLEVLRVLARLE